MIELVSESRCIQCNLCVNACPTNVFDIVPGGAPRIARQSDCQTCYMCELYCPADALYVDPNAEESVSVDEETLIASGLLGSYRQKVGWGKGRTPAAKNEKSAYYYPAMLNNSNLATDAQGRILPWGTQASTEKAEKVSNSP
ncbi:4Fe-4S ferredoxin, iron-sulfur binding protein [Calothrix sp. NIES-2100]|uniref:4Fe-4S dicluster domain-containing protein n=1 Tax=Calothrix sp. NIES-2100 TaxID=1954172 RepID=UPI000B5E7426|nr:4Fe-4S ferredoxin, iron-sulfur binding protein [Calothrix sp. NIES-2100]